MQSYSPPIHRGLQAADKRREIKELDVPPEVSSWVYEYCNEQPYSIDDIDVWESIVSFVTYTENIRVTDVCITFSPEEELETVVTYYEHE